MEKKHVVLTGDRPTGKLHIGHFIGSLQTRVALQNSGKYETYIMIADQQALTDNARDPEKIRKSLTEVALDYLAVGIDPNKSTILVQSQIPALNELTMHYLNLVTVSRLNRNPTVKNEIKQKNFEQSIPAGFLIYPVSQAADITAFKADTVPVGDDQEPMLEQTREIVRTFNNIYHQNILVEPQGVFPPKGQGRLPGVDGNAKMGKSLGNAIYLSDSADVIKEKIMSVYTDPNHIHVNDPGNVLPGVDGNAKMGKSLGNAIYLSDSADVIKEKIMSVYTDPNHIHVNDPGNVTNNPVFKYLDAFDDDKEKVAELKAQYQHGGLGDVALKKYLNEVMQAKLKPIREKREMYAKNIDYIYDILRKGNAKANAIAEKTLNEVKDVIGVDYPQI